jgi:hypothetical protein
MAARIWGQCPAGLMISGLRREGMGADFTLAAGHRDSALLTDAPQRNVEMSGTDPNTGNLEQHAKSVRHNRGTRLFQVGSVGTFQFPSFRHTDKPAGWFPRFEDMVLPQKSTTFIRSC